MKAGIKKKQFVKRLIKILIMQGFKYSCINKKRFNDRHTLNIGAVDRISG